VVIQQPTSAQVNQIISPVRIEARDDGGNRTTGFVGPVTAAIAGSRSATLLGHSTVNAVGGIATFDDLRIDTPGQGYNLVISSPGLGGAITDGFNITPPPPPPPGATHVVITQQPSSTPAGQAISPAITVEARDDGGNRVTTFTGPITFVIARNPGGGTLSGHTTVNAVNGIATFSDLSIDKPAQGYDLRATSPGLPGDALSDGFNITP